MRTDRWLIDGDCEKCRKRTYCSNMCTKRKRSIKNELHNRVTYALLKSTGLIPNTPNSVINQGCDKNDN